MDYKKFINKFEDVFEETTVDALLPEVDFRSLEEWSSVAALSTMAMISEEFDVELTADEMRSVRTFQQLYDLVNSKL